MPEEMKQVPIDLSHVFELLSNKKNDILDIDYSNDNDSYPTVRAVKNYVDDLQTILDSKASIDSVNNLGSALNSNLNTIYSFINHVTTDKVYDKGNLTNIGTTPHSTQELVNNKIDEKLGDLNEKIFDLSELELIDSTHSSASTSNWTGTSTRLTSLTKGTRILYRLTYVPTSRSQGASLSIQFTNNTHSGFKPIMFSNNSTLTSRKWFVSSIAKNDVLLLEYDGNNWVLLDFFAIGERPNVARTGSYNDLTDKPTIPSASSTTPSADTTSGSVGTGTTWARSNHTHPKSSLYAEANHTHGNITNDGKIGTSNNSNKNVVTDANGNITIEDKELGGIELIETTNTSDEELTATSTTLSEVKEGTMILLKVINPFTALPADCRLTLTLKNGDVLDRKLIKHPDSSTYLRSNIVPPNTIFLMRYTNGLWRIIDQYNLATQSFRGFMSAEDKTKLDSISPNANQVNIDASLSGTSTNPVQNKAIKEALDTHTHTSLQKTTITSGNLNNYTDTGWYSYSTANSSSITNTPENVGSVMEVFDEYGDGRFVVQKVYTLPSDNKSLIYYRNKYNTSWGEWIKTDGRDKIEKGIIDGGVNLLTPNRPTPSGTADGTMVENGTLYGEPVYELDLSSTSDTTKYNDFYFIVTPDNFTKGDIFTLSFWAKGNSGNTLKTYFAGTGGYVNVKRLHSNSTFTGNAVEGSFGDGSTTYNLTTDWQHYYVTYQLNTTGDDTLNKSIHLRVHGGNKIDVSRIKLERGEVATDYSSRYNQTTKVPKGANLNDYIRGGFYYNDHDTESANISNLAETGKAFFLLVEDWEESNYTKQTITHHGTRKTYTRIRSAGVWTSWSQLALKSEVYTKAEIDTLIGNIEEDMLS